MTFELGFSHIIPLFVGGGGGGGGSGCSCVIKKTHTQMQIFPQFFFVIVVEFSRVLLRPGRVRLKEI